MDIKDIISGFTVESKEYIRESDAMLYTMRHGHSGARLCYFDRRDENMTFAIAFRTPPKDDTGVFHIIEHSVLCGSEKYPLKDPFVDLLKSSLNTFLNAITYEDRTVYPVASRCERDFFNLADVYLDAVFHPRVLEREEIFLSEGWHYEYDKAENRLSYSGVVYSEMCGAYSSADEIGTTELNRALYGGTVYQYNSGGDPRAIPDLTYEDLKSAHRKYYHPSNSYIYLDGSLDLKKMLALLDSYLSEFDKTEIEIPENIYLPSGGKEVTVKYEIPEGESEEGRVRLLFGYSHSDFADMKAGVGSMILSDILAGSNESVLKKHLLELSLCEDVAIYHNRAERQTFTIEIKGVRYENIERVKHELEFKIRECAKAGIEKDKLTATANIIEFRQRERDFGAFPLGVANALSVFGVWTYGASPGEALVYEDTLAEIRAAIETDYFEKLLLSVTVDNPCSASVIMLPDKSAVADFETEMQTRLDKVLKNCNENALSCIIEAEENLFKYQASADSEEAKAALPTLPLSEIKIREKNIPTKDVYTEGARAISHDMQVGGISYLNLYFDASDLDCEELSSLTLLSLVLTNLPTERGDALSLKNRIKSNLGSFSVATSVISQVESDDFKTVLSVSLSALDTKRDWLPRILSEVLLETIYSEETVAKILLAQAIDALKDGLIADGESFALGRIAAMESAAGAAREYLSGYESYLSLKKLSSLAQGGEMLLPRIAALAKKLFVRERLTLAVTGESLDTLIENTVNIFPAGEGVSRRGKIEPLDKHNEGFAVPTRVAYATLGSRARPTVKMLGTLRVARSIISYEYLWGEVRIIGGAYGTGFVTRRGGDVGFYSYRDPSPENAIDVYKKSAEFLRKFANENGDLSKFIIGAFGEYDILTTPRSAANEATFNLLCGWTREHEAEMTRALLSTSKDDLLSAAELIEGVIRDSSVCVFASREMLAAIPDVKGFIKDI